MQLQVVHCGGYYERNGNWVIIEEKHALAAFSDIATF